ncbi:hypothetical protein CTTA_4298 [Comamonas testosteroni]|uniref:Uncharacterized protein n=1 Tax=Comamonas testosteroni TaxID=285 RepID=A0A5A7MHX9_COMTE|nr:hypothetical protein CTTA_4298 [Comamonas testosteroni]
MRDAKVSMVTGVLPPHMAIAFHAAAHEVGYQPRMLSLAKAFAFTDAVGQIDQPSLALTNEVWWSPAWPFSSGYTSASSAQVA